MNGSDERPPGIRESQDEPETVHADAEEESVTQATRLSARLIYEVIRRDGDEELSRPAMSLVWSGLAAGMFISLSVISQAALRARLPDADWALLVDSLGYSVGFLIVILGRMQLFTENTITTVLPVISRRSMWCLRRTARLWAIVLTVNIVGALIASGFLTIEGVVPPGLYQSLIEVSRHAVEGDAWANFIRSMPAGVLVAAIVWIMPSANGNSFFVILTLTWVMAAGGFAHIVAGTVEFGLLFWHGETELGQGLVRFMLPVLAGNVTGGTAVFALMAWGQVRREVKQGDDV
ncbi:formate/nitrite transporter family protein [Maritimibacter sp. DP07]|jgi:formate/nitrite transporter FocA (FNT family)|uniref:Formate/nitrite transporter family protein n=1 Tax=Maritimibacter harenae TaxID=2606218 RepID=A0A845M5M0_9RHOB|nr:formate/nitrite transporter family protein [Maritimibacter harenae]MZR14512.1 formate/nitrite transporter family protein [Maritimibacter harenae]